LVLRIFLVLALRLRLISEEIFADRDAAAVLLLHVRGRGLIGRVVVAEDVALERPSTGGGLFRLRLADRTRDRTGLDLERSHVMEAGELEQELVAILFWKVRGRKTRDRFMHALIARDLAADEQAPLERSRVEAIRRSLREHGGEPLERRVIQAHAIK